MKSGCLFAVLFALGGLIGFALLTNRISWSGPGETRPSRCLAHLHLIWITRLSVWCRSRAKEEVEKGRLAILVSLDLEYAHGLIAIL